MSASLAAEFAAEGRAEGEEYVRRNTDSMFGWTRRSSRISAKLLCPWSTLKLKKDERQKLEKGWSGQPVAGFRGSGRGGARLNFSW